MVVMSALLAGCTASPQIAIEHVTVVTYAIGNGCSVTRGADLDRSGQQAIDADADVLSQAGEASVAQVADIISLLSTRAGCE
jgi:hypothetical protein